MIVAVLGATGFVGSAGVEALRRDDHKVLEVRALRVGRDASGDIGT